MEKMVYGSALKMVIDFRVDGPMAKTYEDIHQWVDAFTAYVEDAAKDLDAAAYPGERKILVLTYMTSPEYDARLQYHKTLSFDFHALEDKYPELEVFQYTWEEPERRVGFGGPIYAPVGQNWHVGGGY